MPTNGRQKTIPYAIGVPKYRVVHLFLQRCTITQNSNRRLWRAVVTRAQERRSLMIDALSQKYSTELFTSIEYINLLLSPFISN
ncbi:MULTISPECIES: hypothetical protein [unclassified Nostoc]|uniref:hypothetical protein n=1 Tax=unclassified Nostoc TaxID=2593658 RepID=UPI002AD549AF|nr:hypothetical protein [Nostoc sp. DedQUE03]MDZ7976622.1 hypothetical protein [Nostoc sp. DedQUE03]MDZ8049810.1 hypothetical protein [Nostoc sp. DedQUE02]